MADYTFKDDIKESTQDDAWKGERKTADRNYNQEEMVNNTVRVHDMKYIRLLALFCLLLIAILGVDIYNTVTEQDRTIINTIIESVELLMNNL